MGELQIWGNLKFLQGKFKLEFPLGEISIGVSPSGILNSTSGNSNWNLPWGNLKFSNWSFHWGEFQLEFPLVEI